LIDGFEVDPTAYIKRYKSQHKKLYTWLSVKSIVGVTIYRLFERTPPPHFSLKVISSMPKSGPLP